MFIKFFIGLCLAILVIAAAEDNYLSPLLVPRNQGLQESKCENCREGMEVLYSILDKMQPYLEIIVMIINKVCPNMLSWVICGISNNFLNNYVNELKDHSSADTFCQEHNCEVYVLFKNESLIEINL